MKRITIFIICLLLTTASTWAQSGMTDNQVMDYVIEQNANGVSRQQIVTQLIQRGVTMDQIRRIQKKYQKQIKNGALGAEDITAGSKAVKTRMREANGEKREEQAKIDQKKASQFRIKDSKMEDYKKKQRRTYDENDKDFVEMDEAIDFMMPDSLRYFQEKEKEGKRKIFGHDVFNNKNLTFESSMNLATPQNYRLGPGDAVNVDIWGASQESVTEVISPDGTITIEDIGVIQLGGLSVSQAKARLKKVLGPRYQGSQIDLTLGQTRTITVNIMGEVKVPGTYTMSAFATVYNALYMAGGPNEIGTLRNVKVFRRGKQVTNVDVYDFLLNGKLTGDVRLQDNDVITVGPYEALVNITGKVKRPMFYEMKKTESAATLLRYAGGFTGDAYTKAIRINRKAGNQYSVFSVGEFDLSQFKLMDEDSVSVDSTLNRYQNMVEIKGAVFRPGMYHVGGNISTVKALIEAAAGLTEGAISQHAVMHRMKADRTLEVLSVDVRGILEGTAPDVPLRNEDVLYIASREEKTQKQTVTISGEVLYPGTYKYAANESVEDLILQAGGPTDAASLVKVDVSRRITNPNATEADDQIAQTFSFKLLKRLPGMHAEEVASDEEFAHRWVAAGYVAVCVGHLRAEDAELVGARDGAGGVRAVELRHDALEVGLDRFGANAERRGDSVALLSARDLAEDVELARGEGRGGGLELLADKAGLVRGDGPYGGNEAVLVDVLGEVALRTLLAGAVLLLLEGHSCHKEDAYVGMYLLELREDAESVDAGHPYVAHHDVGL